MWTTPFGSEPEKKVPTPFEGFRKMRILIAEDEQTTRRLLERKLRDWGYETVAVSNGNQAWEFLQKKNHPKLILLDRLMPGLDGVEICRRLKSSNTGLSYVILLTSLTEKDEIAQGLDAGADDYISKPFHPKELRARINVGRRMLELQSTLSEKERLQGVLEMAGAVCHEMNQPMQTVLGLCELLQMDADKNAPFHKTLIKIMEKIEEMGIITTKLMKITSYQTKPYLKGQIVDIDGSLKNGS